MIYIFVFALLWGGDTVLLLHRSDISSEQWPYELIGGQVKPGETALEAISREVAEKIDLKIKQSDFRFAHALHCKGTQTEFVALCFQVHIPTNVDLLITGKWPKINQPEKYDKWEFFPMNRLPTNIVSAHKQIIECFDNDINYSQRMSIEVNGEQNNNAEALCKS